MSIVLDGVTVHDINQLNLHKTDAQDLPLYTNTTLPAGIHNITIRSHAMRNDSSDSLITAAIFDYAIYS